MEGLAPRLEAAQGLVPDRQAGRGAAGNPLLPRRATVGRDGRAGRGGDGEL